MRYRILYRFAEDDLQADIFPGSIVDASPVWKIAEDDLPGVRIFLWDARPVLLWHDALVATLSLLGSGAAWETVVMWAFGGEMAGQRATASDENHQRPSPPSHMG